jgi:hypothetical protein
LWQNGFGIVSFIIFDQISVLLHPRLQPAGSLPAGGEGNEEEGKIIYVLRFGLKKGIESYH